MRAIFRYASGTIKGADQNAAKRAFILVATCKGYLSGQYTLRHFLSGSKVVRLALFSPAAAVPRVRGQGNGQSLFETIPRMDQLETTPKDAIRKVQITQKQFVQTRCALRGNRTDWRNLAFARLIGFVESMQCATAPCGFSCRVWLDATRDEMAFEHNSLNSLVLENASRPYPLHRRLCLRWTLLFQFFLYFCASLPRAAAFKQAHPPGLEVYLKVLLPGFCLGFESED